MKLETTRTIAKNLVVAAVMAMTVFASWAITGIRHSPVELGAAGVCSIEGADSNLQRQCKLVAPHG
jgi:hypothetical protein